ncbi:sigma-70 family RNA polymerase sigma factor family protein [Flindersiella endophytica]
MTVTPQDFLAVEFEGHRAQLRAVAYRMLGSLAEAEDAVQEAWLRLARSDADDIGNLGGWLTTVVGRVCLDMLRTRKARREEALDDRLPDPLVSRDDADDPEQQALLADSVGLALQVVLESLTPAERLAFVLHDLFGLPFDQIAPIVDRTPVAAKQLASRARRRVRGAAPSPDRDLAAQRRVVDAFQAAARGGDFEALLGILDPDVVLRADRGVSAGGIMSVHGAAAVAGQAATFRRTASAAVTYSVLVNGAAGLLTTIDEAPISLISFTVTDGRIATIDILSDPDRLSRLDVAELTN